MGYVTLVIVLAGLGCNGDITKAVKDGSMGEDGDQARIDAAGGEVCASLASRLTLSAATDVSGTGTLFAAPTGTNGVVVAWHDDAGLALTQLDASGLRVGDSVSVDGAEIYGLAVHDDAWAVLFSRGSDELLIRSVTASGAQRFETRLLGAVDHAITENEWFGSLIRGGRLIWTGSQWVAYYAVQRLWDDGVAHYGDQIQRINDDGGSGGLVWDWGCSHSMEVRLAHNGTALGPLCASDCFPEPGGVHFSHRTFVYKDSGGNCSGGWSAHLGGVVPTAGAFWLGFSSSDDRPAHDAALVRITDSKQLGEIVWLTEGANISEYHIGPFGEGTLAAWHQGGESMFQAVDSEGVAEGTPEVLAAVGLTGATDFFEFSNGDAGWVMRVDGSVQVARLKPCVE